METIAQIPLIVILGQTASGKSSLAVEIAKKFNGEIICADSRTVYRGMDIGTAKPSLSDQKEVRHHLLDVVDPDHKFNVSDFKRMANEAIVEIHSRGKLPIMVGGSGLYINAVIYDYQFRSGGEAGANLNLELSVEEMQKMITDMGLRLPENDQNPRHLQRIIESGQNAPSNQELRQNTLLIGLDPGGELLARRIRQRTLKMIDGGLSEEVERLVGKFGWDHYAFQNPAYLSFKELLTGTAELDTVIEKVIAADIKLAKKQATWFKRNKSIHWLSDPSKYVASATTLVNNFIQNDS